MPPSFCVFNDLVMVNCSLVEEEFVELKIRCADSDSDASLLRLHASLLLRITSR